MKIVRMTEREFKKEYGHDCIRYFEGQTPPLPFGGVWGKVSPGSHTELHSHSEAEAFVIVQGAGYIYSTDGQSHKIEVGDLIEFAPFEKHKLSNSSNEYLIYLSLYWNDQARALAIETHTENGPKLITATPPTPNGDLHLGHLSGPFSAADVLKRSSRLQGQRCYYLTGIDVNQSYVKLKGEKHCVEPLVIANEYGNRMQKTLADTEILPDHWADPSASAYHSAFVIKCFKKLYADGYIYLKETLQPYCSCKERFISEAFIRGNCPHCGSESDGNACEACGRPNDCVDLQNSFCKLCGSKPLLRKVERFYFKLSLFQSQLSSFISNTCMSPHLRRLSVSMLQEGLPDIAVSQITDWGIPVPVNGFEDQRIYVWFEMAPGYLSASQELAENEGLESWEYFWKGRGEIVQCFGFDNGYYHALLFPAVFMAFDPDIQLPKSFVVNEFYQLNQKKFSTSRGHAIWGSDFVGTHGADYTKLYLSATRPEDSQSNFELEDFNAFITNVVHGTWATWVQSVAHAHIVYSGGKTCDTGAWDSDHRKLMSDLERCKRDAILNYSPEFFSTKYVFKLANEIAIFSSNFLAKQSTALANASEDAYTRTTLAISVAAIRAFAEIMYPITPNLSTRLLTDLGIVGISAFTDGVPFCTSGVNITELGVSTFKNIENNKCIAVV